ncbi:MAG: DUF309 domain-containing protein [Euryarchaeota archaeon]|nr:DUF309 domain-containing protein [Euryarchaeota archaeon]
MNRVDVPPDGKARGAGTVSNTIYDPRYVAGIAHFNAREFFESHEVIEDYWREVKGSERVFLQGVIHAAVALLHFERGKLGSAISQYGLSVKRLSPYRPSCLGLDVTRFQRELEAVFSELLEKGPDSGVKLDRARIPTIRLDPPPAP